MPSSHLTRLVFRSLLAEQTIRHGGCRAARRRPPGHARSYNSSAPTRQRRVFFGMSLFNTRRQGATVAKLEPGMDKLQEHEKRTRLDARLNPPAEIQLALLAFFNHKRSTRTEVQDRQIPPLLLAYEYLRRPSSQAQEGTGLYKSFYKTALKVLRGFEGLQARKDFREGRKCAQLIILLFVDLIRSCHSEDVEILPDNVYTLLEALCRCHQVLLARQILFAQTWDDIRLSGSQYRQDLDGIPIPNFDRARGLAIVIRGYTMLETNEAEMLVTIDEAAKRGIDARANLMTVAELAGSYAAIDNLDKSKEWYSQLSTLDKQDDRFKRYAPHFYEKLVRSCIRNNDHDFGDRICADILEIKSQPSLRDFILVWAAGSGKGVEEVERMMTVLSDPPATYKVTTETINSLISLSLWQKDAYKAERYFHLGQQKGLQFNKQTYTLQIDYRLSVGDVDGALKSYADLQAGGFTDNELASESVNRLICAMCATRRHDFDSIMNVAADLTDSGCKFESETVSTLAILHLSRAEMEDAEDLINTHAFSYSIRERQQVLNELIKFCTSDETETDIAWATYNLLKKAFDDMDREQRTSLVLNFFERGEGTLATQIFEQMRLHTREDTVPSTSTYISCLLGVAKIGDDQAFDALYNLLKLDTSIEPSTALNNALMLACVACGMSTRAFPFWEAITSSKEGPDLASVQVVLRACEFAPGGDNRARSIHRRFMSNVRMDGEYYGWLVAALAAHGHIEEGLNVLARAQGEQGIQITEDMIGSVMNAVRSREEQGHVTEWTQAHSPEIIPKLESRVVESDVLGKKRYKVIAAR